ncbi:hypothetical protein HYU06_04075 [Candidatus Woesearchaeota archaeon]|nr:hypothetical protein [Candidatus Woesearchaeota archaeon]
MNSKVKTNLRQIFNRYNPIGIYQDDETNIDEYDPEINRLIIKFKNSKNKDEFLAELHTVFIKMFDKKIAGPKSRYKKLANEVYDFLKFH